MKHLACSSTSFKDRAEAGLGGGCYACKKKTWFGCETKELSAASDQVHSNLLHYVVIIFSHISLKFEYILKK